MKQWFKALSTGAGKINGVKRYLLLLYVCNLLLALTLGSVVFNAIWSDLGSSLSGQRLTEGFDSLWYNGFSARAEGTAATFSPSVTGPGAIFDALDAFLDGFSGLTYGPAGSGVFPLVVVYFLVAAFFSAGFIATFADPARQVLGTASSDASGPSFFQGAAKYFPRVLLIALIGLFVYWVLYGPVRSFLDARVASAVADSIDERVHFAYTLVEYLFLWSLVWLTGLLVSFSKVSTVKQGDVRFFVGLRNGLGQAVRFLRRHPLACGFLYLALGVSWLLMTAIYVAVVPGAEIGSGTAVALTFLLGQLYILGRMTVRAMVYASEAALFEVFD